jgi:aspartyl-tRNA synthetase
MTKSPKQSMQRSHRNGDLSRVHVGETVHLLGWARRVRNLGSLIFIDLRDRWGLVQLTADTTTISPELLHTLKSVRSEFVLSVQGTVEFRKSPNQEMPTGDIEVRILDLKILNSSLTPPIPVEDGEEPAGEELRLRYRYLDLRKNSLQKNLWLRSEMTHLIRDHFRQNDFIEVETPILTKSTPEGARDYLVPSRVHAGEFFALPQSPQLFKQLLQVSGFERYFQICRCFRDEDLRADRQPEFTQVDVEMSFINQDDIQDLISRLMVRLSSMVGRTIHTPIPQITYRDAMEFYGSDKPDLRFENRIFDVTHFFAHSEFKLFRNAAESQGQRRVRALGFSGPVAGNLSRKQLDRLEEQAKHLGAGGLPYIKWGKEGLSSSLKKFISEEEAGEIAKALGFSGEGLILLAVGTDTQTSRVLGELRNLCGQQFELIDPSVFAFVWVTEFPMFEWNEESHRWVAVHHPFTSPHPDDLELLEDRPSACRALAYDLVLNGFEIGGGSIRIHSSELQSRIFRLLGISAAEAQEKFGFLLEALSYGAPPMGGIALGLDRMAMLFAGEASIREVIAFPKTAQARCLMTSAPSFVDLRQLTDLGLLKENKQTYRVGAVFFESEASSPALRRALGKRIQEMTSTQTQGLISFDSKGQVIDARTIQEGPFFEFE